jgi:hypothetical protein
MKFIIIQILIACVAVIETAGQSFGFEIFSGLGVGILKSEDTNTKFSNRAAVFGGVLGSIQVSNSLFIESGVVISPRGGFLVTPSSIFNLLNNYPTYTEIILGYADIPLLLSANSENLRIYFGPQLSVLTKAKIDYENNGTDLKDIKSTIYSNDIGLRIGIGYVSRIGLSGRLDFTNGFKDVYKDPNVIWKTNSLQIAIGYKYLSDAAKQKLRGNSNKNKYNQNITPIHRVIE